jgi:hypothetical protein
LSFGSLDDRGWDKSSGCLIQVAEASLHAPYAIIDNKRLRPVYYAWDRFYIGNEKRAPGILRDYIMELRSHEIVGPGHATVPVEPAMRPKLVAIGLSLLLVLLV